MLFTILTNSYYDINGILSIDQLDSLSYFNIANSAPIYSLENIPYHHAQRFFLPYAIGLFSNIFQLEILLCFRLFTFVILLLIVMTHYKLTKKFNCDIYTSIISISLLILNPYIFRYLISVPTMANDALFIFSLYLFMFGFFAKSKMTFLGLLLGLISRQNGISILFCYFIETIYKKGKKFFFDKSLLFSILLFIIIFLCTNNYAKNVSINGFDFKHVYGIFEWIQNSWSLKNFISWFLLPLYGYLPALLIILMTRKISKQIKENTKQNLILFFLFFSIIGISYLPGPEMADRNIIRQTILAYPVLIVWMIWFTNFKKYFCNTYMILFITLLLHIWSLHPRYSLISSFEFLREILI